MENGIRIFAGNSNLQLAHDICVRLNADIGAAKVLAFSDGEARIEIGESVNDADVFVVQSICNSDTDLHRSKNSVNDNLVELLLIVDALKRASAKRITAVIPYYGYARQDRKVKPRVPISGKAVAVMLEAMGVKRVLTMDLHAGQIQGFFEIPVDNLYAKLVLLDYIKSTFDNLVMVSPDAGGVEVNRSFAKALKTTLAIVDKRRDGPNEAKAMAVLGDVTGKVAVLYDDMVDTAGTLTAAADLIIEAGAIEVHAVTTHPVLSGPAIKRIEESNIKSLVVTDTIPLTQAAQGCKKIKVISVAELFGRAIKLIHDGGSVSQLF